MRNTGRTTRALARCLLHAVTHADVPTYYAVYGSPMLHYTRALALHLMGGLALPANFRVITFEHEADRRRWLGFRQRHHVVYDHYWGNL